MDEDLCRGSLAWLCPPGVVKPVIQRGPGKKAGRLGLQPALRPRRTPSRGPDTPLLSGLSVSICAVGALHHTSLKALGQQL